MLEMHVKLFIATMNKVNPVALFRELLCCQLLYDPVWIMKVPDPGKYQKGFSFGLEEIPEGHGNLIIEDIIGHADRAMYRQKREHTRAQKNSLT